jgi:hypothetical protein
LNTPKFEERITEALNSSKIKEYYESFLTSSNEVYKFLLDKQIPFYYKRKNNLKNEIETIENKIRNGK